MSGSVIGVLRSSLVDVRAVAEIRVIASSQWI
jgi:hypothetical protein